MTNSQRLWFATVLNLLAAVILLAGGSGCHPPSLSGDVPSTMDPSIAKLVKVVDGETAGYCTVFKVGKDLAMTAGHCCGQDPEDIEIILDELGIAKPTKHVVTYHAEEGHAVPGAEFTVLHDDDEHDACVLRGQMTGAPLGIAMHDPAIGARVWTAGFPKTHMLFSDGLWSGREDEYAKASVSVWGGSSGSPVLDQDGRVVGILVAMYPPMDSLSLITPVEWARAALMTASARR